MARSCERPQRAEVEVTARQRLGQVFEIGDFEHVLEPGSAAGGGSRG